MTGCARPARTAHGGTVVAVSTATLDFLSSLRPADIAQLDALGTMRTFARGQALFHEQQIADYVLVVRRGRVKVTAVRRGREIVLAFRGPGDLLGDIAALDDQPRSATIYAVEPVEVVEIGAPAFRAFLESRPPVALALVQMLGLRLRDADAKRIEFSSYTTIERIAARLLEFAERFGLDDESGSIDLPLSQDELAGATGASVESVGRALQTMRSLGCVQTRRREIRILDRRALEAMYADG